MAPNPLCAYLKTLVIKKSRLGFSGLSALGFCRDGFASRAELLAQVWQRRPKSPTLALI